MINKNLKEQGDINFNNPSILASKTNMPHNNRRKVNFDALSCKSQGKKSQKQIADRFLPIRKNTSTKSLVLGDSREQREMKGACVADLLKTEVLGEDLNFRKETEFQTFSNKNLLKFNETQFNPGFSSFPSQSLLNLKGENLPQKKRKINKAPCKVLDAPGLYDDFYLNLLDWSSSNLLSVGLHNSLYVFNVETSKVVKLVELKNNDLITSVSSTPSSNILAVGTQSGKTQLWDCYKNKKILTFEGHKARVGSLAWKNNNIIASGSRDKCILVRDTRTQGLIQTFEGHKHEVCGLKWSFDEQQLASGGNDNRLNIWSIHCEKPSYSFLRHSAAVKALAWSPHQHGLLVSGGGTADRTIRFWNSVTGEQTKCLDVGSQVCSLIFSKNCNQMVSTHGYSQNQINVWSMPKMQKLETLTGHTFRVLYLALSPDGTTIVTGTGDETLRFWKIFPHKEVLKDSYSALDLSSLCLR